MQYGSSGFRVGSEKAPLRPRQGAARLLRCAAALRVTSPSLRLGDRYRRKGSPSGAKAPEWLTFLGHERTTRLGPADRADTSLAGARGSHYGSWCFSQAPFPPGGLTERSLSDLENGP
jgi:hypothetical protein